MGDIHTACINYSNLLDKEYHFVLGKKNEQVYLTLVFSKMEFYHICGLHKLNDIIVLNNPNRVQIFNDIRNKRMTSDMCKKSIHYHEIDERIELIEKLESVLDSNKTVFKFNNRARFHSVIEADFILKNSDLNRNMYVFISREGKSPDTYFCRSAFSRDKSERDYTEGHTQYTLLYKEKINLKTNTREVLYSHPNYVPLNTMLTDHSNIKQIKFETPKPQGIVPDIGAAAAVLPAPNPFKSFIGRVKEAALRLFGTRNKPDEAAPNVQIEEKEDILQTKPEEKTAEISVMSEEYTALVKAREDFSKGSIPQAYYERSVKRFLFSLRTEEMRIDAAENLHKQLEACPDELKQYIRFEIANVEHNIHKAVSDNPKQTLRELKEAAHEERERLQKEKTTAEKAAVRNNNCIDR